MNNSESTLYNRPEITKDIVREASSSALIVMFQFLKIKWEDLSLSGQDINDLVGLSLENIICSSIDMISPNCTTKSKIEFLNFLHESCQKIFLRMDENKETE